MNAGTLLVMALALPLAMLCACLSGWLRNRMHLVLALAPLPALAAACFEADGSTVVFPQALLGLTLVLDKPGAMLIGVAALLWMTAGAYAGNSLRGKPNAGGFAVWWLMTLTGNFGAFLAADLAGFYLFFTLASLSAYGLVAFDGTAEAKRAAAIYVGLAVLGEALLLMAFVLMAAGVPSGSLLIGDAVDSLATSPWRDYAMAFLILAFGLKIGLFPFHVWMPLTYSAAPIAAAAVLSGSAVKVGVIGLIRFLPFDLAMPDWGGVLVIAGLFSAFYGVVIGITQANPKTVLAYSSVSQMGLLAAALGMGLSAGENSAVLVAAFSASFHVLVKGGLFLAIGAVASTRRSVWLVLVPATVLALGLGGLPLTGGALAKLAMKPVMGDGIVGVLATLSAIGSTLLMLHFLRRMWSGSQQRKSQKLRLWCGPGSRPRLRRPSCPGCCIPLLQTTYCVARSPLQRFGKHSGRFYWAPSQAWRSGVGAASSRAYRRGICWQLTRGLCVWPVPQARQWKRLTNTCANGRWPARCFWGWPSFSA